MGPFTETKWVVCHGPGVVHFSELTVGSSMMTGQPNCEHFDNEQEAKARAEELGQKPDIQDNADANPQ